MNECKCLVVDVVQILKPIFVSIALHRVETDHVIVCTELIPVHVLISVRVRCCSLYGQDLF